MTQQDAVESPENSSSSRKAALQRESANEFARALKHAKRAVARRKLELAVGWCRYAATLAWEENPGFFYCHEMEQLLAEIGREFFQSVSAPPPPSGPPLRFLHIMTTAYETGGHTRVVSRWIETCAEHAPAEQHSILISGQAEVPLPPWLGHSAEKTGGEIIQLPPRLSWRHAAAEVRARAFAFDAIVLHIHPDDPLPNLAFCDHPVPVLFFRHADHVFNLGLDAAQVIADLRPVGRQMSLHCCAAAGRKVMLPLPLLDEPITSCKKSEARRRFALPEDARIALTIGLREKFEPMGEYSFPGVVRALCEADPRIHIVAVGLSESDPFPGLAASVGGRFLPVGVIKDREMLELYYLAADIYLDAYPGNSGVAVLDAARHCLPVQRLYNPYRCLMWSDDPGLDSVCRGVGTEHEFIATALEWLAWPDEKRAELGGRFRNAVLQDHCGASWKNKWLDPAVKTLIAPANADSNIVPQDHQSGALNFPGIGIAAPSGRCPGGMLVAETIDSYEGAPRPVRISGVFHSIKPLLFHRLGDGKTRQRLSLFTWLVASCLPDKIRTAPHRLLRAIFRNQRLN